MPSELLNVGTVADQRAALLIDLVCGLKLSFNTAITVGHRLLDLLHTFLTRDAKTNRPRG